MIDKDGYENYLRNKISLERNLVEIGETSLSKEIEYQKKLVEERLVNKIDQANLQAQQEMAGLNAILKEGIKDMKKSRDISLLNEDIESLL